MEVINSKINEYKYKNIIVSNMMHFSVFYAGLFKKKKTFLVVNNIKQCNRDYAGYKSKYNYVLV